MSEATISRPRRWPLYASLFLNVLLITVLAIGAWRINQARDAWGAGRAWLPNQIEKVLPPDAAAKVRKIKQSHAAEFRPLFRASREAREAVRRQLAVEPFDGPALREALATMQGADAAIAAATADVVVEIAGALSPAERALVREKARDMRDKPDRRSGRDRDNAPPPPEGDQPVGIPPGEMPPPPEGPPPGEADQPIGIPPGEMPEPPEPAPTASPTP